MAAKRSKQSPGGWRPGKEPLNLYRDDLREALGRGGKTLAAMRRALNEHGAGTLDAPDEAVKVWSDLHLGHANIIEYQDRPFFNVDEMDAVLWANWQVGVDPEETLVCVGDVAMARGIAGDTWDRLRVAPGRTKILVVGNHDVTGQGSSARRGVSPGDGVVDLAGRSPADLDAPRAVAERPGRARQHPRAPARDSQAGGLAAHQRFRGATRLPTGCADPDPAARASPGCRRATRGRYHAGADRGGRGLELNNVVRADIQIERFASELDL